MGDIETIKITRDVRAITVPFGSDVTIPQGTEVIMLQELGNTYTVVAGGQTVRIDGVDADALNRTPNVLDNYVNDVTVPLKDRIWSQLKTCYDPEIPVNIVDLGLIYNVEVEPCAEDEYKVTISMTLTAPGCGMGPIIAAEAKSKVALIPQVKEVEVVIVFDPPWDRSRLSDAAKLALGML